MTRNPFGLPSQKDMYPKIDLGFGGGSGEGRDRRRSFTQSQKNQILYQQDKKCARCHKPLDPRAIEYDHKKPWAAGGRTKTINGRALCANCHKIITHNQILGKVEGRRRHGRKTKQRRKKSRKMQNPFGLPDYKPLKFDFGI